MLPPVSLLAGEGVNVARRNLKLGCRVPDFFLQVCGYLLCRSHFFHLQSPVLKGTFSGELGVDSEKEPLTSAAGINLERDHLLTKLLGDGLADVLRLRLTVLPHVGAVDLEPAKTLKGGLNYFT